MNPQLQLMLQQAIQAFQNENFESADFILQEVLQKKNNSTDAVLELGIAYAKANRFMEASAIFCCLQQYVNNDVRIPYNLGLIHSLQGKHQLALEAYDAALKIQPHDVEVLINKGATYNDIQDYALALETLEKAIQIRSDIPEAWSNKGIALNHLNLYEDSIKAYDEAIKLNIKHYKAWSNKSVPLNKLKLYTEALSVCDEALSLKPDYAEAWYNKGNTLYELKRYDEAISHYDKALSLKPDYAEAWSNKGNSFDELKRYEEAISHYDKALSLKPDYAEVWSNKGNSLGELKRYDEAISHYDKALSLKPDYAEAWSNKGIIFAELNLYKEAIAAYDKAIDCDANYFDAYWNKSIAQLTIGDFIEGWKNYEYRWKKKNAPVYKYSNIPLLQNVNDIFQKKLLVWCDQFYGDSIQFSRYINMLILTSAKVFFEVKDPLKEIFKNSFEDSFIISPNDSIPDVDYQISISSLPLLFETTLNNIPQSSAYIKPSNQVSRDWKKILNLNGNKLNIALACSGDTSHYKNDKNRPIKLKLFEPLLDIANIFLVQKEIEYADKTFLDAHSEIKFIGNEVLTFNDTASIIEMMDLTISIDTSIAHLSGALGKTTWLLVSWASDWRWLLDREDSPWYPSMKIYRQPAIGDWNSVLDRVKLDLSISFS